MGDDWLPELFDEDCTGQWLNDLDRELAKRVKDEREQKRESASADEDLRRCQLDRLARDGGKKP